MRDATTVTTRRLVTEVRVAVDYASFVREGTGPHTIVVRNWRVLRFAWPGGPPALRSKDGFFYFPRVNHPRTDPNDWYEKAIASWPDLLESSVD